jgi:hypothetical protein
MLQVLLRITEAVMKRPQENQRKDIFAESLAAILFRVSQPGDHTACLTVSCSDTSVRRSPAELLEMVVAHDVNIMWKQCYSSNGLLVY